LYPSRFPHRHSLTTSDSAWFFADDHAEAVALNASLQPQLAPRTTPQATTRNALAPPPRRSSQSAVNSGSLRGAGYAQPLYSQHGTGGSHGPQSLWETKLQSRPGGTPASFVAAGLPPPPEASAGSLPPPPPPNVPVDGESAAAASTAAATASVLSSGGFQQHAERSLSGSCHPTAPATASRSQPCPRYWAWDRRSIPSTASGPTPRTASWAAPLAAQTQPSPAKQSRSTAGASAAWAAAAAARKSASLGPAAGLQHQQQPHQHLMPRRRDFPRTPEKVEVQVEMMTEDDTPPKSLDPSRMASLHNSRIRAVVEGGGGTPSKVVEDVWKGIPTPLGRTAPSVARRYLPQEEAVGARLPMELQSNGDSPPKESGVQGSRPGGGRASRSTSSGSKASEVQDPLQEFSVTAQRYGSDAACRSMEALPTSVRNALNFLRSLPVLPRTDPCTVRPLLPSPRGQYVGQPTIVLDLDETLAHCSRGDSKRHRLSSQFKPDLTVTFDDHPAQGGVGFRPYVHQFLEVISKSFEVVVFTASQQSYADKVINALDPTGTLVAHRLYRQHCTELRGAFFKELRLLGREASKCILVDNSPISVACNPDHGILIRSWYGDPADQELLDLLGILQECADAHDMGHYLSRRFGLRDFFQALSKKPKM